MHSFLGVPIRIGDRQLTFDDVYNPSDVQREIFHRLTAKTHADKQAQAEEEQSPPAEEAAVILDPRLVAGVGQLVQPPGRLGEEVADGFEEDLE